MQNSLKRIYHKRPTEQGPTQDILCSDSVINALHKILSKQKHLSLKNDEETGNLEIWKSFHLWHMIVKDKQHEHFENWNHTPIRTLPCQS